MSDDDDQLDVTELFPLDGRPGPAPRISAERGDAMVDRALEAWQGKGASRRRSASRRTVAATGAAILVAGAAAAAYFSGLDEMETPRPQIADPPAQRTAASPPPVPSSKTEPLAAETPALPKAAPEPAPAKTTASESPTPASKSLDDWMRQASRLRRRGRWSDAEQAYRQVYRAHPGTLSAYVARVAAASLRLDQLGDPSGARRLFEAARQARPAGSLDVEARQGIANASRRLGDMAAERVALRGLIAAHPQTRAAENARQRLKEIEASGK